MQPRNLAQLILLFACISAHAEGVESKIGNALSEWTNGRIALESATRLVGTYQMKPGTGPLLELNNVVIEFTGSDEMTVSAKNDVGNFIRTTWQYKKFGALLRIAAMKGVSLSTCLVAPETLVCGFMPFSDTSPRFLDDGVAAITEKGVKKLVRYEKIDYGSGAIVYKIIEPSESYNLIVGRDGASHIALPGRLPVLYKVKGTK